MTIVVAGTVLLSALGMGPVASADTECVEDRKSVRLRTICGGSTPESEPNTPRLISDEPARQFAHYVPTPVIGTDEQGASCVRMVMVGSDTPSSSNAAELERVFYQQMGSYPACPDQEALPVEAQVTPGMAAISFWVSQELPIATGEIPPGEMLVGLPAYLVTNAQLTDTFTADSPFGPVRVDATSHLTVDWGDGTVTGPHHNAGEPYPRGDIVHNYSNSGAYDIDVVQHWSATWRIGELTGTLPTRTFTTTIEAFPVEQLQAVRNF